MARRKLTDAEALRLNPKYMPAYLGRGIECFDKGEYDEAIADFTEVIRLNPGYGGAFFLREKPT